MPQFRSIHFDLWDLTYNEIPSISLSDVSVGGAIYEKFKRLLRPYVHEKRYEKFMYLHFHLDVSLFLPKQCLRGDDLHKIEKGQAVAKRRKVEDSMVVKTNDIGATDEKKTLQFFDFDKPKGGT